MGCFAALDDIARTFTDMEVARDRWKLTRRSLCALTGVIFIDTDKNLGWAATVGLLEGSPKVGTIFYSVLGPSGIMH